ncbi:hypothetical protein PYW07_011365 [Mythimna separata]|uniref:Uncharacterized protein n=1 Tax=Mythimna separata TaxID=271217 RepID=A0AAD7Y9G4_MYTSE|nr:hypothetical protein PYW07_011365 [Mythimna separata]
MKLTLLLSVFVLTMTTVLSSTYFFGEQTKDTRIVFRDKLKYEAIPLKKRVKTFTYNGTPIIKAISCYDFQNSEASVNITSGGIGFNYVELRLKSQRSYRLDYAIEIYA